MLEKKQILPIGSLVSVRYASDGGTETVLMIVGYLSLRSKTICHYDYQCVLYPNGYYSGIYYINHSDIVRVLCRAEDHEGKHSEWLDRKYIEYEVYYKNYDVSKRPDIDVMRSAVINRINYLEAEKPRRKINAIIKITGIVLSAGIAVLLTGSWWTGLCALIFALLGYMSG